MMYRNFSVVCIVDIYRDDREDMIAEIYYKDIFFICEVSQEEGFENLKISLPSDRSLDNLELDLNDFLEVCEKTKDRLWEFRKVP